MSNPRIEGVPYLGGRPSKYKPEYDAFVLEHMREGWSITRCAVELNVLCKTLYNWANKHPTFAEALQGGREGREARYERIGDQFIMGNMPRNAAQAVYIFTMKAQFNWSDKPEESTEDAAAFVAKVRAVQQAAEALEKAERAEARVPALEEQGHPGLGMTNQDSLSPIPRKGFQPGSD